MSSSKSAFKTFTDGIQELKDMTIVDPNTLTEVACEAMGHVIEHFEIPKDKDHDTDFCLVFFNTYLGQGKDHGKPIFANGIYTAGDLNVMAHSLANIMSFDPLIQEVILHAAHAFHLRNTKGR
jgi:hypothetical protein